MSLPFSIGDIVEVREELEAPEPLLLEFLGEQGKVETMGISWVKVSFHNQNRRIIISTDKLRRVEDEDTHRF